MFHKSLGSLCSVEKTLIVSGAQGSKGQTMSPIELLWTAKNWKEVGKEFKFKKKNFFRLNKVEKIGKELKVEKNFEKSKLWPHLGLLGVTLHVL